VILHRIGRKDETNPERGLDERGLDDTPKTVLQRTYVRCSMASECTMNRWRDYFHFLWYVPVRVNQPIYKNADLGCPGHLVKTREYALSAAHETFTKKSFRFYL